MSEESTPPTEQPPAPLLLAEALLFVAAEPLEVEALGRLLGLDEPATLALLDELDVALGGRGIRLQRHERRLQLVSAPEAAPLIERMLGVQTSTRLSAAALETLAIIAYRQPITRIQIEAVRGVDCSGVVRALLARGLITETGRSETVGRPILYATTPEFLSQFGLQSLAELPTIELPEIPPLQGAGAVNGLPSATDSTDRTDS
jgi:segregation and condensation protein B